MPSNQPEWASPSSGSTSAERLVLELGRALHKHGTPAHRLESVLERVSQQLGMQAQFFAVPTAIFAAFGPLGHQRSGLVRFEPGGVDLGKLAQLDDIVRALVGHQLEAEAALERVIEVDRQPGYSGWLVALGHGVASCGGVRFFGGGWTELLISSAVGLILGILSLLLGRGRGRHLLIPVAATVAAVVAQGGQLVLGPYQTDVVIAAGLFVFLPGLTLTIALAELSTRHLVSGTSRLMIAGLILLELTFGLVFGDRIGALLVPAVSGPSVLLSMPVWSDPVTVLLVVLSFVYIFQARIRDAPVVLVASVISFYGARIATATLGSALGAWSGALLVGLCCNFYGQRFDRPPTIPLVPAILLLVPGSLGLRSMRSLLASEPIQAVNAALEMTLIGIALAVGILVANVILTPRRDI